MAIITLPTAAKIRRIAWEIDQPGQVNVSEWTGSRQAVTQPGKAKWNASFELVTKLGEDNALECEAFLVDLEGVLNKFRLGATETAQAATSLTPVVDGAGQSGRTLALKSGTPGATLKRGHKLTVNDQMVMLMAPLTFGGDGRATATFKPSLRLSPADNTAVEVRRPTALVALAGSSIGWSVDPGQQYQFKTIAVEEAFA